MSSIVALSSDTATFTVGPSNYIANVLDAYLRVGWYRGTTGEGGSGTVISNEAIENATRIPIATAPSPGPNPTFTESVGLGITVDSDTNLVLIENPGSYIVSYQIIFRSEADGSFHAYFIVGDTDIPVVGAGRFLKMRGYNVSPDPASETHSTIGVSGSEPIIVTNENTLIGLYGTGPDDESTSVVQQCWLCIKRIA